MYGNKPLNVMISCVTKDIFAITKPAIENKIDRIYLLCYEDPKRRRDSLHKNRSSIYDWIYDNIEIILKKNIPGIEIMQVLCDTVKIDPVVKEVYSILINENQNNSIYVNISGATPEYSSGSVVAVMMDSSLDSYRGKHRKVTIVSTGVSASSETAGELLQTLAKELKTIPIKGQNISDEVVESKNKQIIVFYSEPVPTIPDILMIYALREYSKNINRTNTEIVDCLIRHNLWTPVERTSSLKKDQKRLLAKQKVQFRNLYLKRWIEFGWIRESSSNHNAYVITEDGKRLIEMYCCRDEIPEEFACRNDGS